MKKHFVLSILIFFTPMTFLSAQWGPEMRLSAKDSYRSTIGHTRGIAAGSQSVHRVWGDLRDNVGGYGQEIYYRRSTDEGATWGPETRLTYDAPLGNSMQDLAISGSVVHLIWQRNATLTPIEMDYDIYYKRSTDDGVTWSPEIRLTSDSSSQSPTVATTGSMVHVVFNNYRTTGTHEIHYMRSTDAGITWSSKIRISPNDARSSYWPDVTTAGSTIHVAWTDEAIGHNEINYCRSTNNGVTWQSDIQLSTSDNTGSQFATAAASGSYVHVAWADLFHLDGSPAGVRYRRSTDGGSSWQSEKRLCESELHASNYPRMPALCASGSNVYLSWHDDRDDEDMVYWNGEIYYKYSRNNGNTWSHDIRLTYCLCFNKIDPAIAASNQAIHVTWSDKRDYNFMQSTVGFYEIYYKRDATGNIIGVKEELETTHHIPNMLKAIPNPFVSFTTVPGHEREYFVLYDISGRQCGIHLGARIGEMLSAGVYFINPLKIHSAPVRIVKIK